MTGMIERTASAIMSPLLVRKLNVHVTFI